MPFLNSPEPPAYREVLILGRPGAGADGAAGGVCLYDRGEEIRLSPGDVAEVPVRVASSLIADGLALDPSAAPADDGDSDDDFDPEDAA